MLKNIVLHDMGCKQNIATKSSSSLYISIIISGKPTKSSYYKEEMENIEDGGILTYNGKYVMYNVLGNIFELSSKYIPPIQPVGRGPMLLSCES